MKKHLIVKIQIRRHGLTQEPPIVNATSSRSGSTILGLDGLRAFSISLVLIAHLLGTRNFHLPEVISRVLGIFFLGPLGVRVFFVISGFLITSLLLEEERRTGTVSLRCFYFSRTLRIFPPYYLYISIIVWKASLDRDYGLRSTNHRTKRIV
jgi:peptidoglycan/LPS O-acetylase OafA/YrhL